MSRKNLFTVLLAAVLVLGIAATAFANPGKGKGPWKFNGQGGWKKVQLNDLGSHWAAQSINAMCLQGIITGYPDFTFRPNKPVTKYEALLMISRADGYIADNGDYNDVLKDCLDYAVEEGIITEDEADDFKGGEPAKRYEVAVWAARASGLEGSDELSFMDNEDIPQYARYWVGGMLARQYMVGYPDRFFQPNKPVTRAEMAMTIYRIMLGQQADGGYNYSRTINGYVEDVYSDSIKIGSKTYEVTDDATIRVDGKTAELDDVDEGDRVTAYLNRDGEIVTLYARTDAEDDNDNLEIEKLTPADGSDDADTDTDSLVARFNMEIRAIDNLDSVKSGVRVRNVTDGEYVDINEVSINGEELVIELEDSLEEDKTYRVTVNSDVIEARESGENFEGISGSEWEFSTGDSFTIVELTPENDEEDVSTGIDTLEARFSGDIRVISGKSLTGSVSVYNRTDLDSVDISSVRIDEDTLVITLDDSLERGKTYEVTIKRDYLEEKDTGDNFAGVSGSDWSFTTRD